MQIHALNQRLAAEMVGVTARTLRDWSAAPRNDDGTYDGPALVAWRIEQLTQPELNDQRQRLAAAQAEKVEHENAVRRGELADMRQVERYWSGCIANARARLLKLPTDIAASVTHEHRAAVQEAARRAVHDALTELSNYRADEIT